MPSIRLENVVEGALTSGLAASAALLLFGLERESLGALRLGTMFLIATPIARVVIVTAGMFRKGDRTFGFVSLWVLLILGASAWVAFLR